MNSLVYGMNAGTDIFARTRVAGEDTIASLVSLFSGPQHVCILHICLWYWTMIPSILLADLFHRVGFEKAAGGRASYSHRKSATEFDGVRQSSRHRCAALPDA